MATVSVHAATDWDMTYRVSTVEEFKNLLKTAVLEYSGAVNVVTADKTILNSVTQDLLKDLNVYSINYSGESTSVDTNVKVEIDYYPRTKIINAYKNGGRESLNIKEQMVLEKAEFILAEIITPQMSDYEKEKAVHDYLVLNAHYDDYYDENLSADSHEAYGALVKGVAVCQGYSEAFEILLSMAGVPCEQVYGTADGEKHSWNRVLLDGKYYMVDATWDDDWGEAGDVGYGYFNITDVQISYDHQFEPNASKISDDTAANYFYLNNFVAYSQTQLEAIAKNQIEQGDSVQLICSGFTPDDTALKFLFNYTNSYYYVLSEPQNVIYIYW